MDVLLHSSESFEMRVESIECVCVCVLGGWNYKYTKFRNQIKKNSISYQVANIYL